MIKQPKVFAKKPQVNIKRNDNGLVNYDVVQTNFSENSFITNLFNGKKSHDIETLSASATSDSNQVITTMPAKTVAPTVAATTIMTPTLAETTSQGTSSNTTPAQAEQMLQYWWLQADEKTRKEFMSWAIKQL